MEAIEKMTDEELEKVLEVRKKRKQKEREDAKKRYEQQRDETIHDMMSIAVQLSQELCEFKEKCHDKLIQQNELLNAYGGVSKNSKGGFSITSSDGKFRITRRRDVMPSWDERANKATELIRDFLKETVKKKELIHFEMLMGFLERNIKGDLEYSKVFQLIKYQEKFDDRRWKEGLELLKESYSVHMRGYCYEFKTLDDAGKWHHLPMNFSSI